MLVEDRYPAPHEHIRSWVLQEGRTCCGFECILRWSWGIINTFRHMNFLEGINSERIGEFMKPEVGSLEPVGNSLCGVWDPFMVPWIIDHAYVLECKRSVAIKLKMALFGFDIRLPAWVVEYIKLYYLCVIVMFTNETNLCKFSTSFYFCGKELSFHIVDIPIIVIKLKASFNFDFVTEAFFITKFSVYGISASMESANLRKELHLAGKGLEFCWFVISFAYFIDLVILHICDVLWGRVIMCDYQFLYACFRCGNIVLIYFNWL